MQRLILASGSASRRAMLEAAGVTFDVMRPKLDEDALKEGLKAEGHSARNLADALAEAKALRVSQKTGPDLVLGGDQVLVLDDGELLDKPVDPDQAIAQLTRMAGTTIRLISAAVMAEEGRPVWRDIAIAKLHMRSLSDAFIHEYVTQEWDRIRHCVGCFQIESRGAQLFTRIEGDNFTVQGMPLLAILGFLRDRELLPS